jgi:ComF family protein
VSGQSSHLTPHISLSLAPWSAALRRWGAGLAAAVWPLQTATDPICELCGKLPAIAALSPASVCLACAALVFNGRGHPCRRCGRPIPSAGPGPLCDQCLTLERVGGVHGRLLRVAHLGLYEGALAAWLRDLKYRNRTQIARPLGNLLSWPVLGTLGRPDLVVPVPLHPTRLQERGYNQAALLADAVAAALGLPARDDLLVRHQAGPPQAGLARADRLRLLTGAIGLGPGSRGTAVRGLDALLVDDVLTTGATLEACAAQLLSAGARRVLGCVVAVGVPRRLWA